MCYLRINTLYQSIKTIVLPSLSRHKLKLLSKCCVFKVCQYACSYIITAISGYKPHQTVSSYGLVYLDPTAAFLMHPVFAAIAVATVVACSCMTYGT